MGKREISTLTKEWVEAWRDWLGEKYSASTVNTWLTILRMILRDGGLEAVSRVSGLSVDDTRTTEDAPNLLEDEEAVTRMLELVKEKEPEHYALIGVLVTTGLRISTALALRREDFEPARGVITARRRLSDGELLEGVKRSRTARDVVPLVEWVWQAVEAEWAGHNPAQAKSGLAFPNRDGGYRTRTAVAKPLKTVSDALGVGRLTPHGLRRTAALLYRLRSGSAVSKAIAGHLTEEMHLHYAPVLSRERAEAGRAVFGAVGRRTATSAQTGDAGLAQNGDEPGTKRGQDRGRGSDLDPAVRGGSAKVSRLLGI
ncbi:MAG: site-specific integrase [Myxococcota bacterium]